MTLVRTLVAGSLLALVLGASACGDEVVRVTPGDVPNTFADVPTTDVPEQPDAGPDATAPDTTPPLAKVRRLEFADAFGDDQVPCQGTDRCSIFVSFTENRTLKVKYTEDGAATEGQLVRFDLVDDPDGLGKLNTLSSYSDATGLASVQVSAKQTLVGQFTVRALVDDLPPLYFDVLVTPKGQVPLTVIGEYYGTRPDVVTYSVRLYRQDGSGAPGCGDIPALYEDITANWQSPVTNLGQSVKKQEFEGLAEEGTQKYTIMAFSQNPQGIVQAWGCDDVNGEVKWGWSTSVEVELLDRPPRYAGSYNVTSQFDLVSALPPPIDGIVNGVLDFFKNPVGQVMVLFCQLAGQSGFLEDLCDFVFDDPQNPNVDDLTATGAVITDILEAVINGLAKGTIWGDILVGGKDVSEILTAFQIDGTIELLVEPDANGNWYAGDATELWEGITVKWSLGNNCDPLTDQNCGKKKFNFYALQGDAPVNATFTAHVEDMWDFTIDLHPLNVKYGLMLNTIIEKVLLPLLAGDGSDGGPVIDSYELFLSSLVGGKECLAPSFPQTCCQVFSESVISGGGSTVANVIEGACDALIELGSQFLAAQISNLSLDTGDAFKIGTLGTCKFIDADKDLVVDAFGTKSKPCAWDVQLEIFGGQTTIDAIFWASRAD